MIAEPIHRAPLDIISTSTQIPLGLLDSAPAQPREQLPDIEALARNISSVGLLQPICARRVGGRYTILSGHRRAAAFRWLQEHNPQPEWASIPALVLRVDDDTAQLAQISAQVHMEGWTPLEECQVLDQLVRVGLSHADIAHLLQKSQAWVSKRIRAYRDDVIGEQVLSGQLAPGTAEELLTVRAPAHRREMATRAAAEGWSQSEARQHVRRLATHPLVRDIGRRARVLSKELKDLEPSAVTGDVLADLARLADVIQQRFPRHAGRSAA